MSLVVALDDLKPEQIKRRGEVGKGVTASTFFRATRDMPDSPSAYINKYDPGRRGRAHFHVVDQFQIIVEGKGKFGKHDVSPYCIHFSRAHTPYGPLQSDKETGWAFMTLRSRYDPGAQHFPESKDKLRQTPDRRPWQITKKVTFPAQVSEVSLQAVPEIKDEQGLFSCSLSMPPNTRTSAPDPSGGDGQYVIVVKGSVLHDNKEQRAPTVVFIKPEEQAFQIHAGGEGLQALILNFPRVMLRAVDAKTPSTATGLKKWQCLLCSFAYDEALGMPDEGIAVGTRWQDVPDTWTCPDCGTTKTDFQMVEV